MSEIVGRKQQHERITPQFESVDGELILDVFRFFAINNATSRRPDSNPVIDNFLNFARRGLRWEQETREGRFRLSATELRYGVIRGRYEEDPSSIVLTDTIQRSVSGTVAAINADALSLSLVDENGVEVEILPVIDHRTLESLVDIEVLEQSDE